MAVQCHGGRRRLPSMIMTCTGLGRGRDDVWEVEGTLVRACVEAEDGGVTGALGTDGVCVHLVDASGRRMDRTSDMDAPWTEACSGSLGPGRVLAASVRSGMTIWQGGKD